MGVWVGGGGVGLGRGGVDVNGELKFLEKFKTSSPKGNDCSPESQHVIITTKF